MEVSDVSEGVIWFIQKKGFFFFHILNICSTTSCFGTLQCQWQVEVKLNFDLSNPAQCLLVMNIKGVKHCSLLIQICNLKQQVKFVVKNCLI